MSRDIVHRFPRQRLRSGGLRCRRDSIPSAIESRHQTRCGTVRGRRRCRAAIRRATVTPSLTTSAAKNLVGIPQRMGIAELMQIDKDQVLELLRSKGEADKVEQADRELPDRMDTDDDVDLLSNYGLGPQEVIAKLGGGPLGGLTGR